MDQDITKQLTSMIRKLERTTYDEAKADPEYKGLTPKQFERNLAERVKALKDELARLKK